MTIKLYYNGQRLYSNRIIGETLSDPDYTFENINFAQGDGITTTLTLNNVDADTGPSYLTSTDDSGKTTEWFVLASNKTRKNQLVLTLRRDFLDENWESLTELPFLCSRASTITNSTAHAQYLKTTSLSQIKSSQKKLSDRSGGYGWLVGYVDKDFIHKASGDDTTSTITVSANPNDKNFDISIDSLSTTTTNLYRYINSGVRSYTECTSTQKCYYQLGSTYPPITVSLDIHTGTSSDAPGIGTAQTPTGSFELQSPNTVKNRIPEVINLIQTGLIAVNAKAVSILRDNFTGALTGALDAYEGKIIKDLSTGYRYTVTVVEDEISGNLTFENQYMDDLESAFYSAISSLDTAGWFNGYSSATTSGLSINISYRRQRLHLARIVDTPDTVTFRSSHVHTTDALYDVFAIPLGGNIQVGQVTETGDEGDVSIEESTIACHMMTQERAMQLVTAMYEAFGATSSGTTLLYDVQWLPYGPISDGEVLYDPSGETSDYCYSPIKSGTNTLGAVVWLKSSQLTKRITYSLTLPEDLTERRIYEEEHMFRLVGPNFASQFEFSPVRNNGLEAFYAYLQFKPYSPYIRIVPKFAGLYGINAHDSRGLILTGDFSCDSISDAWTQYKLQNKNYELIFNRQIQSMDLQNEYQNNLASQAAISERVGLVTNTVSAVASGFGKGALTGNAAVAGVMGAVNGAASLTGGIIDYTYNQRNRESEKAIRDDTRDAAIDQFQYQIGNIKAMPDTITKISTFNPDYQIYPILETYKCTAQEDTNLRLSIQYNGIDINEMTYLSDYSKGFVQGSLMQITGLNLNDAQAAALNSELQTGIYIREI